MKRLVLAAFLLVAAACAGGSSDSSSSTPTTTSDDELDILELKCRNDERISTTRLDLQPGIGGTVLEGTLQTDEGEALLICESSHPTTDGGRSNVVISCVERPKEERPTEWTVEITAEPDGQRRAHIDRHQLIPSEEIVPGEELSCARITAAVPVLPYSVVQGYIHRTCDGCHSERFDTLEKIRAQRDLMLGMISAGIMPKRNLGWRNSDEGQLTLAFLAKSHELD